MLVKEGYVVHSTGDGQQCLDLLAKIRPDLILMDIEMPNVDGITACRRIREDDLFAQIPIIFITSHTDDKTLQAAFDAGGTDYVRKPIGRVELLARVCTALAQRRAFERRRKEELLKGVLETAGAVCHELNQPLQYVLGAIQLLIIDTPDEDPKYRRLQSVFERVEQMGDITRKLSNITRYRTRKYMGNRDIIDLEKAIATKGDEEES